MLHVRLISAESDLEKYVKIYQKFGMYTSVPSLMESDVYVFFHKNNPEEWVAGFTITTQGAFRYLSLMPADQEMNIITKFGVMRENLVEIGGLFLKTIRVQRMERVQVYAKMLWETYKTGRSILIAGSFLPKERAKQMKVFPEVIFDGPIEYHGKSRKIWIYLGSRKGFAMRSVIGVIQEIRPAWENPLKGKFSFRGFLK